MVMVLESRALLSTIVVNNPTDTPVTGQTDLRQAIAQANRDGGGDTIEFSSLFNTPHTITLSGGQLEMTGRSTTTIQGPGANLLSVSGNNASRVFQIDAGVTASISGLTVTGGNARYGGGIWNWGGTVSLSNVAVTGNSAKNYGGGLLNTGGTLSLTNCTVSGNSTANRGGGLANGYGKFEGTVDGTLSLTNCTVAGNNASDMGGGLFNTGIGVSTLTNATVSGNTATFGGGLFNYSGELMLTNSIVSGNNGTDISGSGYSQVNSLIGGNPLLGRLGFYGGPTRTIPLLPGSPAMGGGTATGAPATDQRGVARPKGTAPDIGAFQSEGFTLAPVAGSTPQPTTAGSPFANPLAVTVTANNPVEPVDGGVITFTAPPATGASATLSAGTATITGRQASVGATANATRGTYIITATATEAGSAGFTLTNTAPSSLVVTTQRDSVDDVDGLTSLREAIAYANNHPGPDTIIFGPAFFGTRRRTIRLTGGPLVLTDPATTTIIGPGAGLLTISGDGKHRIFDIEGGSLALEGMTVTGGRADRGGGILNDAGTVALDHVVLRGNRARVGGGIYNNGATTLTDVIMRDNTAGVGPGLFSTRSATLAWRR
jgi:hypothetical protein